MISAIDCEITQSGKWHQFGAQTVVLKMPLVVITATLVCLIGQPYLLFMFLFFVVGEGDFANVRLFFLLGYNTLASLLRSRQPASHHLKEVLILRL